MVAAEAVEGVDLEEDEEGEVVVEVEAVAVEVVVIRIVMREEIDPTSHTNITPCGLDKYTPVSHHIVETVLYFLLLHKHSVAFKEINNKPLPLYSVVS